MIAAIGESNIIKSNIGKLEFELKLPIIIEIMLMIPKEIVENIMRGYFKLSFGILNAQHNGSASATLYTENTVAENRFWGLLSINFMSLTNSKKNINNTIIGMTNKLMFFIHSIPL